MFLIPEPKKLTVGEGVFCLSYQTQIVLDEVYPLIAAKQLQADIAKYAGIALAILRGEPRKGDIVLKQKAGMAAQAYQVSIGKEQVTLQASDRKGMLYAVQTMRQIIRQSALRLPIISIDDAPAIADRGYFFDVSRGRVSTLDTLKKIVDEMCLYKLNQFQLYMEHTYLFRDLSEVWRRDTPLTAQEIMELDDYCMEREIELVPSLATFGHMYEILKTKQYAPLCEMVDVNAYPVHTGRMHHHTINAADPRSIELVKALIDEYMPLFKSRKFNICCDETFDLGKGRGKEQMEAVGEKAFYSDFVKALLEHVLEKGHTPMMWGDIILKFPDAIRDLPSETIYLNWGYEANQREDETRIFHEYGATQYTCPGVASWNLWLPDIKTAYQNITNMCRYGKKYGAIGMLNTDWGDFGHIAHPALSLPGLMIGAMQSWQEKETAFDEALSAISALAYSDASASVVKALCLANQAQLYTWYDLVKYHEGLTHGPVAPLQCFNEIQLTESKALFEKAKELITIAIGNMEVSKREMAQIWLNALHATEMFDRVGECIALDGTDPQLALELEKWYHSYCTIWRQGAKEGDLWRIGEKVVYFADRLRG